MVLNLGFLVLWVRAPLHICLLYRHKRYIHHQTSYYHLIKQNAITSVKYANTGKCYFVHLYLTNNDYIKSYT